MAEFAFEASAAEALATGALAVAIAIGYLALVVFQTALFALPARVALAAPVHVVTTATAKHRTDTYSGFNPHVKSKRNNIVS